MSNLLVGRDSNDDVVAGFPIQRGHAAQDQNMVLYLGLFLLLLVFFILLWTLSQQRHDRAIAAAGSLTETFGHSDRIGGIVQGAPLGASVHEIVADRVGRLVHEWSDRFPIDDSSTGERIQFALPVSAVFSQPDAAAMQPAAEAFLADLAALTRDAPSGAKVAIDVIAGSTIVGAWNSDAPPPLAFSRAASLARYLDQTGLGPASLTVGVEVVKMPAVRFVVRVEDAAESVTKH